MSKNCDECGHVVNVETSANFCSNCGVGLIDSSASNSVALIDAKETHSLLNGDSFVGELKDGKPDGHGKLITDNGSIEGNFVDGMIVNIGSLRSFRGHYVGEFRCNTPHGFGRESYQYGFREGQWIDGEMTGKGVREFGDRTKLTGNFVKGIAVGYGVEEYREGTKYEGNFEDNQKNGWGKETFLNGSTYEGEYVDKYFQGNGTFTFPSGKVWSGKFIRERGPYRDGSANFWRIEDTSGKVYFGQFHDDGTFVSSKIKRFLKSNLFRKASW